MDQFEMKGLDGMAGAATKKWYGPVGLIGLAMFASAFLIPIPADPVVTGATGAALAGFGFGNAECRTFRTRIGYGFQITGPAVKVTFSGFVLYLISIAGIGTAALRLMGWI